MLTYNVDARCDESIAWGSSKSLHYHQLRQQLIDLAARVFDYELYGLIKLDDLARASDYVNYVVSVLPYIYISQLRSGTNMSYDIVQ